jgi:hypothetical protein
MWGELRQKWEDGLQQKKGETFAAAAVDNESTSKQTEPATDTVKQSNDSDQDTLSKDANVKSDTVVFEKSDKETQSEVAASKSEKEEASSPDDRRSQFARQDSTMSTASIASVGEIDYEVRFVTSTIEIMSVSQRALHSSQNRE